VPGTAQDDGVWNMGPRVSTLVPGTTPDSTGEPPILRANVTTLKIRIANVAIAVAKPPDRGVRLTAWAMPQQDFSIFGVAILRGGCT
jgi:hypothetical protein